MPFDIKTAIPVRQREDGLFEKKSFDIASAKPVNDISFNPDFGQTISAPKEKLPYSPPLTDAQKAQAVVELGYREEGKEVPFMTKADWALTSPMAKMISANVLGGIITHGIIPAYNIIKGIANASSPNSDVGKMIFESAYKGLAENREVDNLGGAAAKAYPNAPWQITGAMGALAEVLMFMPSVVKTGAEMLSKEQQFVKALNTARQSPKWGDLVTKVSEKSNQPIEVVDQALYRELWKIRGKSNYFKVLNFNLTKATGVNLASEAGAIPIRSAKVGQSVNFTNPQGIVLSGTIKEITGQRAIIDLAGRDVVATLSQLSIPEVPKVKPTGGGKVDPLIAEAKKYKSAEEFVASQPKVYHQFEAGEKPIFREQRDLSKAKRVYSQAEEGIYFSPNKELLKAKYGKTGGEQVEVVLDIKNPLNLGKYDAMYFDGTKISYGDLVVDNFKREMRGEKPLPEPDIQLTKITKKAKKWIQDKGYDAVIGNLGKEDMHVMPEYVVFNKSQIKTKSQLIDIWNKAQAQTQTPTTEASLLEEAKKYKSAEEFVEALDEGQAGVGSHVPYAPLKRLLEMNTGKDTLVDAGMNPDDTIIVYRGVDDKNRKVSKTIQAGDYVATSRELARSYVGDDKNVVSIEIKAKDFYTELYDGINEDIASKGIENMHLEGVYNPNKPITNEQLTDIWNKAHNVSRETSAESALIEEAKKYKSAEEFVESKGLRRLSLAEEGKPITVKVYHGTPDFRFSEEFDPTKKGYYPQLPEALPDNTEFIKSGGKIGEGFKGISITGNIGVSFTDDYATAKSYADKPAFDYQNSIPKVLERYVTLNNPKVIDLKGNEWDLNSIGEVIQEAKDKGYDGLIFKNIKDFYHPSQTKKPSNNLIVFDVKNIKTKSQLIDIWNKAQAQTQTPTTEASLLEEAKKYKSAEEFVEAQGTPVYHGTNVDFEQIGFGKGVRQTMLSDRYEDRPAIFFSPKKSDAEFFAQNRAEYFEDKGIKGGKQRVIEAYLDIKNPADFTTAKKADAVLDKAGISYDNEILGIDDVGTTVEDEISSGRAKLSELAMILDNPKNIKKLQDAGFDGAVLLESEQYGLGKSYAVFNPKQIKTKSQLIDIWNKANTPTQPQAGEVQQEQPITSPEMLKQEDIGLPPEEPPKFPSVKESFLKQPKKKTSILQYFIPAEYHLKELGFDAEIGQPVRGALQDFSIELMKKNEFLIETQKEHLTQIPKNKKAIQASNDKIWEYMDKGIPEKDTSIEAQISRKLRTETDEMLSRMNELNKRIGRDEIKGVKNYILHMLKPELLNEIYSKGVIPPELAKVMEYIPTKNVFLKTAIERKGVPDDWLVKNPYELMRAMYAIDLRYIYLQDALDKVAPYLKAVKEYHTEEGDYWSPETYKYLDDWVKQAIKMRPSNWDTLIDNMLEYSIAPLLRKAGVKISHMPWRDFVSTMSASAHTGALGMRVRPILRNLVQSTFDWVMYGTKPYLKASTKFFTKEGFNILNQTKTWKTRVPFEAQDLATLQKIFKIGGLGYRFSDLHNVGKGLLTRYYHAIDDLGMTKEEALKWVDEDLPATQWSYRREDLPRAYWTTTGRAFWTLGSWWMNFYTRFLPELSRRAFTGKDVMGREVPTSERLGIMRLFVLIGLLYGIKEASKELTGTTIDYTGQIKPTPLREAPIAQLLLGFRDFGQAIIDGDERKRKESLREISNTSKIFIPWYLASKDLWDLLNGKKDFGEFLFYGGRKKKKKKHYAY